MPTFPLTPRPTLRLRLVRPRNQTLTPHSPRELIALPIRPRSVRVTAPLFRGTRARKDGLGPP